MKILKEPRVPTKWELMTEADKMLPRKVHPTWAPYLGFAGEEEETAENRDINDRNTKMNNEGGGGGYNEDVKVMSEDIGT